MVALATRVHTFNVWDVDVELGEFFTRALHALVHRLQDLFGVLLHPSEKHNKPDLHTSKSRVHLVGIVSDLFTYPSLGKLCLISTWWWLSSSAVFELNTFKEKERSISQLHITLFFIHPGKYDWMCGHSNPARGPLFGKSAWILKGITTFPYSLHFPSSAGIQIGIFWSPNLLF